MYKEKSSLGGKVELLVRFKNEVKVVEDKSLIEGTNKSSLECNDIFTVKFGANCL